MNQQRPSPQKPEEFIGWKSPDGKLEVIGIADEKSKNGRSLFKVTCIECSKDKELFPLGYFVSAKSSLISGGKPCGCSLHPYWNKDQYLINTRRAATKNNFIMHGLAEDFHGCETKVKMECIRSNHIWEASMKNVQRNVGCPFCNGKRKLTTEEALIKCTSICKDMNYIPIGFQGEYENQKSRFEYICDKHGIQNVGYNDFINKSTRCPDCWKEKQRGLGNGNGYYPERKDEQDFLYILDFNGEFIKVGRCFDLNKRINELQWCSWIDDIQIIRVFTATHNEVYAFEQNILYNLRVKCFQYNTNWSYECFYNEALDIIYNILDTRNDAFIELHENINPETKTSKDDGDKP